MCVGLHIDLRVMFVVVTTFYTLVGMKSTFISGVALVIIICPPLVQREVAAKLTEGLFSRIFYL